MSGSKTIGGINVTISATTTKFVKGIGTARRMMTNFVKGVKNLIFSLKGLAVAFAAGMFVKFTANQFEAIAALGDLSDKLGISTEKLAGYQLAAAEAGIANSVLEKGLVKLTSQGLTLRGWIEDTAKLSTHQEKLAAAVEKFGVRGADMVRFLNVGADGMDEAQRAAVSLGLALDRKTVAGVDRAGEAFARFKMAVSGIFRSLAAEIAPFIEVLSNKATSFLATNGRGKGIGSTIANVIVEMAKIVTDSMQRMVQAVLGMVSDLRGDIIQFRKSAPAKLLGMGYTGAADKAKAIASFDVARKAHGRSLGWERPSVGIERLMADARKQAAAQAALLPGADKSLFTRGKNALGGLFGGATAGNAKDFGGQLIQGILGGIRSVPGLINSAQWEGMKFAGNNWKGSQQGQRPALSFAESGSADSYRQQAAIRRQGEDIAKKQLKKQEAIAVAVQNIDRKMMPGQPLGLA